MKQADYAAFDRPEITRFLFHPRSENGLAPPAGCDLLRIRTADGTRIGGRSYFQAAEAAHILFFHGNGEIAQDYDDIARVYNSVGLNFSVIDYRGYGTSEGTPTIAAMLADSHDVFEFMEGRLAERRHTGPRWIMGRSLGSAPAIEAAHIFAEKIDGLIIESGFARTLDLLARIGIDPDQLGITENPASSNQGKIADIAIPTLIMHGEFDQIIPVSHARDLFRQSPASAKKLHIIPGADHNTLMPAAGMAYFQVISDFITENSR